MPTKLRLQLDTQRLNWNKTQWSVTALDPLDDYDAIVERAIKERAAIDASPRLTSTGRKDECDAKRDTFVKEVLDKHTPRFAGLEADVAAHRAALLPVSAVKPDDRRIDFLLSQFRDKTPEEIAMFYGSATDDERVLIEHAAASVGRIPTKGSNGLQWRPLLPPETIHESVIARAAAKNPIGATKLQELSEIRDLHATIAAHAVAEIKDVMSR